MAEVEDMFAKKKAVKNPLVLVGKRLSRVSFTLIENGSARGDHEQLHASVVVFWEEGRAIPPSFGRMIDGLQLKSNHLLRAIMCLVLPSKELLLDDNSYGISRRYHLHRYNVAFALNPSRHA